MNARRWLLLVTLTLPGEVPADVVLSGNQHIGDTVSATYTPADYVNRTQHQAAPSNFNLSDLTVVSAVRLDNPIAVDRKIEVYIDGVLEPSTTLSNLITLTPALTLDPGTHTLALDPGCAAADGSAAPCPAAGEHDIGFSSITLISTGTTDSVNLNRRRHIGQSTETDTTPYTGRWYPNTAEAVDLNIAFTTSREQKLDAIEFHRLRDVDTDRRKDAEVEVDGTLIGKLTANADPFVITSAVILQSGSHTLTIKSGTATGSGNPPDDISWDDIVLLLSNNPTSSAGRFNAVEPGQDEITGRIYTKVAGTAFNLDIVALKTNLTVNTGYQGTVDITLLNAHDSSGAVNPLTGCRSSWTTIQSLGSLTFTTSDSGRKQLSGVTVSNAVKTARLFINDAVGGIAGCSLDAFAIRPATFTVAVSDQDDRTAGTARNLLAASFNANSIPTHRAGRPLTIRATALNSSGATTPGYDGNPSLSVPTSVLGSRRGTVSAGAWSTSVGIARTDTATYSEVGAFTLRVRDTTFTAVDNNDGTSSSVRRIGPVNVNVGRFTPDDFTISYNAPRLRAGCGSFSYIGQPVRYSTAPVATITAINASGGTTRNYTGSLFKLSSGSITGKQYVESTLAMDPGVTPSVAVADDDDGIATMTFDTANAVALLRGSPVAPYNAEISLQANLTDSDGIAYSANPLRFGNTTPGNGIAIVDALGASAKEVRFGRLSVLNAYGSERLSLQLPLRVEHYLGPTAGSQDFAAGTTDACTTGGVGTGNVSQSGAEVTTTVTGLSLTNGAGNITLSAPSPSATGRVTLTLDVQTAYPWLRVDADSDNSFLENSSAVASFGLYKGPQKRVYLRETVR